MPTEILSIGHSSLEYEQFLLLLKSANVTAIADVRSHPYSRHQPHFNKDELKEELRKDGIAYVSLPELGGRPSDPTFYCEGVADYQKMAEAPSFETGISRVLQGSEKFKIALMCSENSPFDCHRCLLVGRALLERGVSVAHILPTGKRLSQAEIEETLLRRYGHGEEKDMFITGRARIADAYREQAKQVAYRNDQSSNDRFKMRMR